MDAILKILGVLMLIILVGVAAVCVTVAFPPVILAIIPMGFVVIGILIGKLTSRK